MNDQTTKKDRVVSASERFNAPCAGSILHALASVAVPPAELALSSLAPFGLSVEARSPYTTPASLPLDSLRVWVLAHRVLLLRGFAPLVGDALPAFGRSLGELHVWSVGTVNETDVCLDGSHGTWTDQEVPMHRDLAGCSARYLVFHCDAAPPAGCGGETLFSDTIRVLDLATPAERTAWTSARITYGGHGRTFSEPLVGRHPLTGAAVLRYAEPIDDIGHARERRARPLFANLRRRLYDPAVCYPHPWREGDVLLADNHALLHGRAPFALGTRRRLRRVNVM